MGIKGVQEIFLFIIIIYTFFYLIDKLNRRKIHYVDLYVFCLVLLYVVLSAAFSKFRFGQPLEYGVFEARITFAMFVYFPLRMFLVNEQITPRLTLDYVLIITMGIIFFASLVKFNVIPKSFVLSPIEGSSELREDRNSMGRYFIILSFIYTFTMYAHFKRKVFLYYFIVITYAVFFILQEKQVMIGLTGTIFIYMVYRLLRKGDYKILTYYVLISGSAILFINAFYPYVLDNLVNLLSKVSDDNFVESMRYREITTIVREMGRDYGLLGHGSIWNSWNGGFARIYGDIFFVGDVGIIGTFYRLGLLFGVPIVVSYLLIFSSVAYQMRMSVEKDVVVLGLTYLLLTFPTSAPIAYRGYYLGLLLAIAVSMKKRSNPRL